MAERKTLILAGDSYAAGRLPCSKQDGALAAALRRLQGPGAEPRTYDTVDEQAVSGSTAADWARGKLRSRLQAIAARSDCACVLSIGGNDFFEALRDGRITLGECSAWLRDVLTVATMLSSSMPTILLIYPNPHFLSGVKFAAMAREALYYAYRGIARVSGCTPLDLSTPLSPSNCWDSTPDIHPSETGYAAIARAIAAVIAGNESLQCRG